MSWHYGPDFTESQKVAYDAGYRVLPTYWKRYPNMSFGFLDDDEYPGITYRMDPDDDTVPPSGLRTADI